MTDTTGEMYKAMTRPKLARHFSWFAMGYIAVAEAARMFGNSDGANWEIAAALIAQPLGYVGARTVEKRKASQA